MPGVFFSDRRLILSLDLSPVHLAALKNEHLCLGEIYLENIDRTVCMLRIKPSRLIQYKTCRSIQPWMSFENKDENDALMHRSYEIKIEITAFF